MPDQLQQRGILKAASCAQNCKSWRPSTHLSLQLRRLVGGTADLLPLHALRLGAAAQLAGHLQQCEDKLCVFVTTESCQIARLSSWSTPHSGQTQHPAGQTRLVDALPQVVIRLPVGGLRAVQLLGHILQPSLEGVQGSLRGACMQGRGSKATKTN